MDGFKKYLLVLFGLLILSAAPAPPVSHGQGPPQRPRQFYLTRTLHTGGQALSACAAGYHMASLWEIHDPSNLRYDTDLGLTRADSGFGPPTGIGGFGWIRTGYFAESAGHSVGTVNCNAWRSADSLADGTAITLPTFWDSTSVSVVTGPWFAAPSPCNSQLSVWCVED
jgi:hypothetical protein